MTMFHLWCLVSRVQLEVPVRHRDRPDAHHRVQHKEPRCMIQYLVHYRNDAQHGKTLWKTCLKVERFY